MLLETLSQIACATDIERGVLAASQNIDVIHISRGKSGFDDELSHSKKAEIATRIARIGTNVYKTEIPKR